MAQVREGVAPAGGSPGTAGRLQRLPHTEPSRLVRRDVPEPGPAYDGANTSDVV